MTNGIPDIISPEMMTTPFAEWQLNLLTIFVAAQVIGRAYAGLKNQGGLRGLFNGILFGTNTPKK